ncbi:Pheromone receptor [Mycena venus]|uniref:Pheromone receptor n=1 Tax=Mycena venus TaxID=2733690 RepID=A0A8H6XQT5_9AGAR|nr:Pheromone receptor [Mycena venus]
MSLLLRRPWQPIRPPRGHRLLPLHLQHRPRLPLHLQSPPAERNECHLGHLQHPRILTIRVFMKRCGQFNQFLTPNTALTGNRDFRLMTLATIELAFNTSISLYRLYLNVTQSPIAPWISWDNTHFAFGKIGVWPAALWRSSKQAVITIELSRRAQVFCAFIFFTFFGFAAEARKNYRLAFWAVAKHWPSHLRPTARPHSPASAFPGRSRSPLLS